MTVFRWKVLAVNPAHTRINLYAGPDVDHLGMAGYLTFRTEEFAAFTDAITQWNERHGRHLEFPEDPDDCEHGRWNPDTGQCLDCGDMTEVTR